MPERRATDQKMRIYVEFRRHHPQRIPATRSGLSEHTGRRIEGDPRLPSQKAAERPLRRQTADPLAGDRAGARNHFAMRIARRSSICAVVGA